MGTPSEKIWPGVRELPAMKKCNFAEYPYNTLKNRFPTGLLDDAAYELMNKLVVGIQCVPFVSGTVKDESLFCLMP